MLDFFAVVQNVFQKFVEFGDGMAAHVGKPYDDGLCLIHRLQSFQGRDDCMDSGGRERCLEQAPRMLVGHSGSYQSILIDIFG